MQHGAERTGGMASMNWTNACGATHYRPKRRGLEVGSVFGSACRAPNRRLRANARGVCSAEGPDWGGVQFRAFRLSIAPKPAEGSL
jgi:hypothetical protein